MQAEEVQAGMQKILSGRAHGSVEYYPEHSIDALIAFNLRLVLIGKLCIEVESTSKARNFPFTFKFDGLGHF